MAVESRTLVLRGPISYVEVKRLFHATWPGLDVFLFVEDHPYWKEHQGELEPGAAVVPAGAEVTLVGGTSMNDAGRSFTRFNLATEIYRRTKDSPGSGTLDHESDAALAAAQGL